VRDMPLPTSRQPLRVRSFLACVATILEMPIEQLPQLPSDGDPATGWLVSRWLGGRGLGIVRVAEPTTFSWPGPWLARVGSAAGPARYVVMYGVPSGVTWDPGGDGQISNQSIEDGFVLAATDIALALPAQATMPPAPGAVDGIWVAASAGEPVRSLREARVIAGRGLAGDRHAVGAGTFPSGLPGSALTLIEAEVCESFDPPLRADEHRRNLVTRGVELNGLVGREFMIGDVRCRGMRLCEPCRVMDGYASRPLLRALVHRGGLRADILRDGEMHVGDRITVCSGVDFPSGRSSE
jgi:MOSC domain